MPQLPHAKHVLLRNEVFPYEEFAPYEPSGLSIKGGFEYEKARDLLKCHECGVWFENIRVHAWNEHKLSSREYKRLHGIEIKTGLVNMRIRRIMAENARRLNEKRKQNPERDAKIRRKAFRASRKVKEHDQRNSITALTLNRANRLQLIARLKQVALALGHPPTVDEIVMLKVSPNKLKYNFGSVSEALEAAGFKSHKGRPKQNPTEEKDSSG